MASSRVKAEQAVTAAEARMPARRDARNTWEMSKISASSISVSPWRVITRGTRQMRESAVA
jgi:hypothetical protein